MEQIVAANNRQAFEDHCIQILTEGGYCNIEFDLVERKSFLSDATGCSRGRVKAKRNNTEYYAEFKSINFDGLPSLMSYTLTISLSKILANVDLSNTETRDECLMFQFGLEGITVLGGFERKFPSAGNFLVAKIEYNNDILLIEFYASSLKEVLLTYNNQPIHTFDKASISADFDSMNGHEFEQYCANILQKNNYTNITVTRGSGDQGIDIIAFKDGIKYGIQCKCYSSDIGNKAVQEVFAGKTFYQCHVGVVLTNRYFTNAAIELAQANGVVLWDRDRLMALVESANKSNS